MIAFIVLPGEGDKIRLAARRLRPPHLRRAAIRRAATRTFQGSMGRQDRDS